VVGEFLQVPTINVVTWGGITTGGCLGLFYGLLIGRMSAMCVGLAVGSVIGYTLGLLSVHAVGGGASVNSDGEVVWRQCWWLHDSAIHFTWQSALAMLLLHVGACIGAILGTGPTLDAPVNRKSAIENRK
jgi:hypothetical protein